MSLRTNRRDFLKGSAAAGIGFWVAGGMSWAQEHLSSRRTNGSTSPASASAARATATPTTSRSYGNVVAICDVDENRLNKKARRSSPRPKKFTDFRKMFDEMGKEIDAVTVSTPDHTHAAATMMAIKLGKHVYCQKPLTHDVWEAPPAAAGREGGQGRDADGQPGHGRQHAARGRSSWSRPA